MLRRGAIEGVRKKSVIPTESYEISTTIPDLHTEAEQIENELFGDIEQQFVKKSSPSQGQNI